MRVSEILRESADPFIEADIGTILSMQSGEGFNVVTTYVMKLSSGTWVTVAPDGAEKGVERFSYVGAPVPLADLHKAMQGKKIGLAMNGFKQGERIYTGVQIHALPDGAILLNPGIGDVPSQECVKVGNHMERDGKPLPDWAFTRSNSVWK